MVRAPESVKIGRVRKREKARQKKVPNLPKLVGGFILTLTAEGKSPKTISFYGGNLSRFLWYAKVRSFSENAQELTVQRRRPQSESKAVEEARPVMAIS